MFIKAKLKLKLNKSYEININNICVKRRLLSSNRIEQTIPLSFTLSICVFNIIFYNIFIIDYISSNFLYYFDAFVR